ncbi:MAG: hypothetical protein EHM40_16165 [Chloroflexi bacterium]|nr:MAG: hypothetical protein EHM40_16165 [Chloroflexota bacterium]
MDNQPAINREFLIPILIGGFSVVGIIVVLLVGRLVNSPAEIAATPSSTPFQYVYLGTEPAITTLVVEGSELPATDEPADEFPPDGPPINTPMIPAQQNATRTATGNVLRTGTPSRMPTATRTNTPSTANTYDDTDSRLDYSDGWISQSGLTGSNAPYNGTLHISDVADDKSVTIQFSGQEIFFYYLSGPSGGIVTIYLDDDPLALTTVNQAQGGGVWHFVLESTRTHRVRIEHTGGGSVNVDRFVIPAPTPTPTRTPTP